MAKYEVPGLEKYDVPKDPRKVEEERKKEEQKVTVEVVKGWFNGKDGINFHSPQSTITLDKAKEIIEKLSTMVSSLEKQS